MAMKMCTRLLISVALVLWLGPIATFSAMAAEQPLLIPGKTSLYQRVLAIPGAYLDRSPGDGTREAVTPFTAFYVYDRRKVEETDWLQVGTDRHGRTTGWLRATDTLEWTQGLTVAFREPVRHERALLFRDAAPLRELVRSRDMQAYDRMRRAAEAGQVPADSPVVAIQPPGKLDIRENFYLVPILRHEDLFVGSERARLLQVSSVPLDSGPGSDETRHVTQAAPAPPTQAALAATPAPAYRAGLAFAIDSTLSMDPYIQRTREAVMKIYDALGDAGLLGNVNFGLVAFRDSLQAVPDLEYLARTYIDLEQGSNPGTFLNQVRDLRATTFSSQDFREDAFAGVRQALDDMDWSPFAARYLVLITDAGPRDADDPLSSTGMDAAALRELARSKGVAIFVLHLLTPSTQADHANAAAHYRELAKFPGVGSLYYAVPTGDLREFGQVLDTLAGQITLQVQMAAGIQSVPVAAPPRAEPVGVANPRLAEFQTKIDRLGYALRMQYLRRTADGKIPNVFNAWLLDRDFRNPAIPALDVQVLLTRDQLSDLHDILKGVLYTAEEGLLSPQSFLDELKSLAATITRDPDQLGNTTATTAGAGNSLADLGFMREYIEDLPYTAEVMTLSLEDWEAWPARQQIAFLHRLEDKISYYRSLHDNTDLWISLDGGPIDGDSVFPVALEMLP